MIDIKKIFIIFMIVILIILSIINIFAEIVYLPEPPIENQKFLVVYQNVTGWNYYLYYYTSYEIRTEYLYRFPNCISYKLIDGKWELEHTNVTVSLSTNSILYDSEKIFSDNTKVKFPDKPIKYEDFSDVINIVTKQININNAIGTIVIIVIAIVGLVFIWWAVIKLVQAIMTVFKKGKIKL